jgi:hypothetical protein
VLNTVFLCPVSVKDCAGQYTIYLIAAFAGRLTDQKNGPKERNIWHI